MAQLSSPGVAVTVVDESFYTPAAPGTVPLIVVASAENKQNGAATGTAFGTLKANAGKVYLLTSQKDLSDTFGIPKFYTDASNNPIHAGEQNEYGLEAAYSFLGVSNRAYVVRADLDLGQLTGTADAPHGAPADGTFWFDTIDTKFGVFEWNVSTEKYTSVRPVIITDKSYLEMGAFDGAPIQSFGAIGQYAVVSVANPDNYEILNKLYYKKGDTGDNPSTTGMWVEVGSEDWSASWPTASSNVITGVLGSGTVTASMQAYDSNGTLVASEPDLWSLMSGTYTAEELVDVINGTSSLHDAGITASLNADNIINIYSKGNAIQVSGSIFTNAGFTIDTRLYAPALAIQKHTQIPSFDLNANPTGSIWVKTTKPNLGADWIVKKYSESTSSWSEQPVSLYKDAAEALNSLDPSGGGLNLALGSLYVKYNDSETSPAMADFKIYARRAVGPTTITSVAITPTQTFGEGTNQFYISWSKAGSNSFTNQVLVSFDVAHDDSANTRVQNFLTAFHNATIGAPLTATRTTTNQVVINHAQGGDIRFVDDSLSPVAVLFNSSTTNYVVLDTYSVATLWTSTFEVLSQSDAPVSTPEDGRLWYNTIIDEVDILVHNGHSWVGYQFQGDGVNSFDSPYYDTGTDPKGPIVSATKPKYQSDDTTSLADGDLWVNTSSLEDFPELYRFNGTTKKWVLIDSTDQTTQEGILFHDARWSTSGQDADPASITSLLASNFLDPDAPDPALYPRGMLLWNLRRSGFNVKKYHKNYIDISLKNHRYNDEHMDSLGNEYYPDRWVSEAANQEDGAGTFGRKAVRKVVTTALNALVNSNQQIRDDESRIFNLIACPGYPELITALVGLNYDRGLSAFVIGDTPARLTPDATTLSNWGNNTTGALDNGDKGLLTTDAYLGLFYPWGYTTDLIGNNIVVPPSHMMLRTIALSDNVSYPWFAPAGVRRGGITNVSSVGYVSPETGEFQAVALNGGQRDTLASIHVNPITYITGTGLVNYGQYTRQLTASALDRINVARLVVYLRRQFAQLAKPYVFEPNDTITRNEIKQAAESLLLELVGQRALYDYLVVCDTSNNTPARIDRSELYLDVAIEPVKAVEFIYIPLRLKNTGEIKGLG